MKFSNKYKNKNHLLNTKNTMKPSTLHFGSVGLICLENKYIDEKQMDSCTKTILKKIKSRGVLVKKINPFLGITSKPAATRMGKGKGMITSWAVPAKKGMVLFEITCTTNNQTNAKLAFKAIQQNLNIKTKIIVADIF